MADEYSCMPSNSEINIPSATIEYEVVDNDRAQSSPSSSCAYETIQPEKLRIQIQHAEKREGDPSSPLSEFSTYHNPYTDEDIHTPGIISKLSGTGSLRAKHAHTRQLNIFIGEELENNFQRPEFPSERRAYSCPPTPRAAKRAAHPLVRESLEPTQMGAEGSRYEDEPMHFFIYNLPEEEPSTYNEYLVKSNPYNKINHMIHSALHCPCFFFFFLLCCMPGVHWMQVGDDAYKNGDVDEAKSLGRKATVSYFIGAVLGVLILTGVIMISVYFVQDQLVQSASEKSIREERNHLIVVLGDDVDVDTMGDPEEVRAYVKTHVIKRLLNALPDIDNHELYIKHDNNNFLEFENKNLQNTKIKSGHSRIVADVFSNEEKKNGHVQMQNEK